MGMDVMAIIKHDLTPKEILEIPERSTEWNSIKELYVEYQNPSKKKEFKEPDWYEYQNMPPETLNEELIEKVWSYTEDRALKLVEPDPELEIYWGTLELDFYWGTIEFYRSFIVVSPSILHKYGNLFSSHGGTYILKLFREVSKNFGQTEILYFPDSGKPTQLILDRIFEKNSFEDVKNWANKTFGNPPTEINEAIHNHYFIDDVNTPLQEIDPEKEVFKRWDYVDGKDVDRLGIWKGHKS